MKKLLLCQIFLFFVFFVFNIDSSYAQCSPGCGHCVESLGVDTVQIRAEQPKCDSTEPISYEVDVLFINSLDSLSNSEVIRHSATINHKNNANDTKFTWSNSSDLGWSCTNPITDCRYNTTQIAGVSAEIYDPANYPGGIINFDASVDIEILYPAITGSGYDLCLHQTLTLSGDSCTVTLPGTPTPTPIGDCNPSSTCGADDQCLPSQICNASRKCEVLDSCGCTGSADCGGSTCPGDSVCVSNRCIQEPLCILCTDTTRVCGAKGGCAPWERCTNKVCKPDPLCVPRGKRIFCTKDKLVTSFVDSEQTPYVYTAIGCVDYQTTLFVSTTLQWSLGIGGAFTFLVIIWGAFIIITNGHDPKKIQAGWEMIIAAISGTIMIIFSVLLVNYLGDQILNLGPIGFSQ